MKPALVILVGLCGVSSTLASEPTRSRPRAVEFNRDVRPLLSNHCYPCHGPDAGAREAELRLDLKESALAELTSGGLAVVAGDRAASVLYQRITAKDPADRMPPEDFGKPLTQHDIETIGRWIDSGAEWQPHWVYVPPQRAALPASASAPWARGAIDGWILARLDQEGLAPAPMADRITLVRRLYFDLVGLPPSPGDVDAFLENTDPDTYEQLVDRLLASPHFGERLANFWLDLVRYADTVGYHGDQPHNSWPYRDYVIEALNQNMPFDQFTVEQLAGDLLPNATLQQRVASAYNRLNMTTEEGGAQPGEYLAKYAADRVRTTASVWMGATMGCAQCHDHKFDPYTIKDFYRFAALFADIKEMGKYPGNAGRPPEINVPTPAQTIALDEVGRELERLDEAIGQREAAVLGSLRDKLSVQETPPTVRDDGQDVGQVFNLSRRSDNPSNEDRRVENPSYQGRRVENPSYKRGAEGVGVADDEAAVAPEENVPENVREALGVDPAQRTDEQNKVLTEYLRKTDGPLDTLYQQRSASAGRREAIQKAIPLCMVSESAEPRVTRVLARGDWMDTSGEVVQPGVPEFLGQLGTDGRRATRLDLARWLISPRNPLTARVLVNRLWKRYFGSGISRVLDDLGSQGQWPEHPQLLDGLALELIDSGWDIKHVVRLMVTSSAYRQSSQVSRELFERDPANQLVARQARYRLEAELVRDAALTVSGLIVHRLGGPSVKPYQPAGYYAHLNFPKRTYAHDANGDQYRRGVYIHWQRTYLHPSLLAFDAPSREECTAERPTSNTPQAALVLLNDPSYVEAARALAVRIIGQGGSETNERLEWVYREVFSRRPSEEEIGLVSELVARHRREYAADPDAAKAVLAVGLSAVPESVDPAELAAWTSVARVVLNLSETIARN